MIIDVDNEELRTIIEEVTELAEQGCEKFRLTHDEIRIVDRSGLNHIGGTWKTSYDGGFGFTISNHNQGNQWYRLIILNTRVFNELNLSRNEIKAVILHELGHLLNQPILSWEPSHLDCRRYDINFSDRNNIIKFNRMRKEVRADAYAKKFGFVEESLALFEKHNQRTGDDVGFLEERTRALHDEDPQLDGFIVDVNENF